MKTEAQPDSEDAVRMYVGGDNKQVEQDERSGSASDLFGQPLEPKQRTMF